MFGANDGPCTLPLILSRINLFTMKRTAFILLGLGLAMHGIAQLPAYDTSMYTFIRSAATDSVILGQQQLYKDQTVALNGVVSDQNKLPVQGALAVLGNHQYTTVTDRDGRFSFDLPHQALAAYNVVSVSAPGKKTSAQTLHWTALPATVNFQLQPITRCGCPPDSIVERCCNINISMTVDQLFEKESKQPTKKMLGANLRNGQPRQKRRPKKTGTSKALKAMAPSF
jgi:Carboxypeptidase regulatory-like domain